MRAFSLLISILCFSGLANADLGKDLKRFDLEKYERAGHSVSRFLRLRFVSLQDESDETTLADRLEQSYSEQLRPGALENLSSKSMDHSADQFLGDIQKSLELKRRYSVEFRTKPAQRLRLENVFSGLLHVLEIRIHGELGSSLNELVRLRRFLLTQATFVSKGGTKLTVDDLWWDWMWLRGHEEPSDLVEFHLAKIRAISKTAGVRWQERLRKYALSVSLRTLRRESEPLLEKEKPAVISLRLVNEATRLASVDTAVEIPKELKLYRYKYLQATGQTYEASEIKKDIAKDVFLAKGKQLFMAPAESWARTDIGFVGKVVASAAEVVHSILTFITYGAGFLFVATPIELLLILAAWLILSRQAKTHFKIESRNFRTRWVDHRLMTRDGWRRIPAFVKDGAAFLRDETGMAWRMFVASYTTAQVPFYSKVAASLLLFGVGLYFNSARSLVEAVVTQMTM